jgi:hypothetical protein
MSQVETVKDTVFYSKKNKDIYSPQLMKLMQQMPFAKNFSYFRVDDPSRDKKTTEDTLFLFNITSIPTIYVSGKKLEGETAYYWLVNQSQRLNGQGQGQQGQQGQQGNRQYQQQQPMSQQQPHDMGYGTSRMAMGRGQGQSRAGPGMSQEQQQGPSQQGPGQLAGASGSCEYASLFDPTTISAQEFSIDDIENPIATRNNGRMNQYDDVLEKYQQGYREDLVPANHQPPPRSREAQSSGFSARAIKRR